MEHSPAPDFCVRIILLLALRLLSPQSLRLPGQGAFSDRCSQPRQAFSRHLPAWK